MPEAKRAADQEMLYERYVNPQWVRLLDVLRMNVDYARCVGAELHTTSGRRILDFISGYCVHNIGHNHPRVISALKDELDRNGPAMLQSHVSELAGELAARLCDRAGGRLTRAFFCSSGSEGIETVIKFARAHAGRPGIVYAAGGFHGLTCGALSLMANPFWEILSMLRQFAKELRKVVIMASHDPRAQRFADRVFSLTDGRIDALT